MKSEETKNKDGSLIKNGVLTIVAAIIVYPVIWLDISIAIASIGVLMVAVEFLYKFSDPTNSNS